MGEDCFPKLTPYGFYQVTMIEPNKTCSKVPKNFSLSLIFNFFKKMCLVLFFRARQSTLRETANYRNICSRFLRQAICGHGQVWISGSF